MEQVRYKTTNKFTPEVLNAIIEVQKTQGLTAENLLEKAKDRRNPLHDFFDWNNDSAAVKYRLHQARLLINEVKILVNEKEIYAFENVNVSVDELEVPAREYKPVAEILSNDEYRKQVISTALKNITHWQDKYKEYGELKPIFVSIEKVKAKWQKKN